MEQYPKGTILICKSIKKSHHATRPVIGRNYEIEVVWGAPFVWGGECVLRDRTNGHVNTFWCEDFKIDKSGMIEEILK
jgi:hypothetical protein